ncbi:MAG: sel1 repeat family protein [Akkermansiaceae bacterium]|nr:sel1 repeat family protein [Akkermansiaceae bacterium]
MKSKQFHHVVIGALAVLLAACTGVTPPNLSSVDACNRGKEIYFASYRAYEKHKFAKALEEAYPWFRMSAEQNHSEGELWLAKMYDFALDFSREGVKVNLGSPSSTYQQEAEKWYKRAADHGNKQAAEDLAAFRRTGSAVVVKTQSH